MLRGIPELISPDLMTVLMEMGHGDEIVLADANFPAVSHARRLVRAHGLGMVPLLQAILTLFPLDRYVEKPVALMRPEPQDPERPAIWIAYWDLLGGHALPAAQIDYLERAQFYERSRGAFAIVATGELALYGNILLKKGAIDPAVKDDPAVSADARDMAERLP